MIFDFSHFPELRTERLTLRAHIEQDIYPMFEMFTDKKVLEYYNAMHFELPEHISPLLFSFNMRFASKEAIRWAITTHEGEFLGVAGLNSISTDKKAIVNYALAAKYWGKGYATEALDMIVKFGFQFLELVEVNADVLPGNIGSERVLIKSGFEYVGFMKEWMVWNGKKYDVNMYKRVNH